MITEIIINTNSKGGKCCSYSIDLTRGCNNKCESCYGLKVSMLSRNNFHTDNPIEKVYNDKEFIKSIKKYRNKGMEYARLGKFSDPGYNISSGTLSETIKASTKEGIKLVLVSKSFIFKQDIAKLLRDGDHTLHMSCGMISNAQSNEKRIYTYNKYKEYGVNSKLRIVEDITKEMPSIYKYIDNKDSILTPLRFNSKSDLIIYETDMKNFTFKKGYYRPNYFCPSWDYHTENLCGDIGDYTYCCECLVRDR